MRTTATGLPRRGTDRVEDAVAWVLLTCALFLGAVGVVSGMAAYAATVERGRVETAERTPTTAVLTQDVPSVAVANPTTGRMPASATWRDPAGTVHTGIVDAGEGLVAGATVPVWVDRSGAIVPAPVSADDATMAGLIAGAAVVAAGAALLTGIWWGIRRATAARNAAAWEQEWARVGPAWRGGEDAR